MNQTAAKAVGYFTKISKIEDKLAKLSAEERHTKRLELVMPVLDELFAWAETVKAAPRSKLGEAFTILNTKGNICTTIFWMEDWKLLITEQSVSLSLS